jgi:threonine dehydrogenase-like Zn-dependent dehydrogenase
VPKLKVYHLALEEVFQDMARLVFEHRPHSKAGKVIVLKANNRKARAIARGAPGRDANGIYLDDVIRDRLALRSGDEVDFTIERAGLWDEFVWGWQATNAVTRVGSRLGIIGLALGIAGLLLGIWSVVLTFKALS